METCGFCGGSGRVLSRAYDRFGAAVEQRMVACEYCDGSGCCEDGDKLMAGGHARAGTEHAADLAWGGSPTWALTE